MQTFRKRRAGLSATAGLSCSAFRRDSAYYDARYRSVVCLSVFMSFRKVATVAGARAMDGVKLRAQDAQAEGRSGWDVLPQRGFGV